MKKCIHLILFQLIFLSASTQWVADPAVNTPVSTLSTNSIKPFMVSDGYGGAFIAWDDYRNPPNAYAYVQHVNYLGNVVWTTNGIPVCAYRSSVYGIVADGSGGVIVCWQDVRNGPGQVYAQRFNASGIALWTLNGVVVSPDPGGTPVPAGTAKILADGNGGAFIAFGMSGGDGYSDIYAQHISSTGTRLWNPNAVVVTTAPYGQETNTVKMTGDGSNGIILVWTDGRSFNHNDVYTQRINSSGIVQWTTDGVLVAAGSGFRFFAQEAEIASDGNNGAFITWEVYDDFNGPNDKYCNRINATGSLLWTAPGVKFTTPNSFGYGQRHQVMNNGSNDLIIAWLENRGTGTNHDVYVQKIDLAGAKLWGTDGVQLFALPDNDAYIRMVTDNAGGAVISWQNWELFDPGQTTANIFARRIDVLGIPQGDPTCIPVCTAAGRQQVFNLEMISNGFGGAILAWDDERSGSTTNIYANHILNDAVLPVTLLDFYGRRENRINKVFWSTSSEQNNKGFDIERSADGVDYQKIGFVAGQIQSFTLQHYSYTDLNPLPGKNYYRLKQWDIDDRFKYSKIILLDRQSAGGLTIFPNPATNFISIQSDQTSIIQIFDASGKLIKNLRASANSISVDISEFAPGVYFCRSGNAVARFVKK